jgi:hypothetical protein
MIEYVDVDGLCAGVEIYSFETTAWIYKESEWAEDTDVTFYRQPSVFLMVFCTLWGTLGSTL